jgi:hypothetical protein
MGRDEEKINRSLVDFLPMHELARERTMLADDQDT